MTFAEWERGAPRGVSGDPLWRMQVYRFALFAVHVGWPDVKCLGEARVTEPIAAQLYRALGSVAANIAEGYSRSSGVDRARLFEYALGSARESIVWYAASVPTLGPTLVEQRCETLASIRRLLLTTIPAERRRIVARG